MRRVLLSCVWLAVPAVLSAAQAEGPDALLERAAAYVADYQRQLTAVVADETYTQRIRAQVPPDRGMPPSRTTTSEIFFLHLPGFDWMAMRDVLTLDGRPVGDRPDLKEALRTLPPARVAREFKAHNSRFNLGRVVRNFNEPTLALLVLDPRHRARFTFTLNRTIRKNGRVLPVLGFRERAGPTLVRGLNGGDVFATGEITIDAVDGRVLHTLLGMQIGSVQMTLGTDYRYDARLDMMVPAALREHYRDGAPPAAAGGRQAAATVPYEEIACEAAYTNFRRFEVVTRIR